MDRRSFMRASALASVAATGGQLPCLSAAVAGGSSAAAAAKDVTHRLAKYVVAARFEDLPEAVRKEVGRSLLNWMGVAVGGSRHATIEIALAAVKPFAGAAQAGLVGRGERLDVMHAAFINAISSHVFDFDDTDLTTAVHPSAPVARHCLHLPNTANEWSRIRHRDGHGNRGRVPHCPCSPTGARRDRLARHRDRRCIWRCHRRRQDPGA